MKSDLNGDGSQSPFFFFFFNLTSVAVHMSDCRNIKVFDYHGPAQYSKNVRKDIVCVLNFIP